MIEKKTGNEIYEEVNNHSYSNTTNNKIWISEDSLRENLLDMYRLMCNKYGKANIWTMNAEELLEKVDLLINDLLEKVKEDD
jgi:hypothetical protein